MNQVKPTDDPAKLWELIKETRYGMLTHRHLDDGLLHSHPLTTQNKRLDADAALFFFIPKNGVIAKHLPQDNTVNMAYVNSDDDSYVSIAGRACLLEDDDLKKELFNPLVEAWFPEGLEDPNLGLLAVEIISADYWDVKDSKVTQLFKMVRSAVTGEQPQDMAEHGRVVMG